MGYFFAVTGKGGVGKTTLSALLVNRLIKNGKKPVLAIDADPNSCLDAALGVTVTGTVGSAREEMREESALAAKSGISKHEMLQLKIAESLVESGGFDLISMGRPEGAGCYCYANNVLKSVINEIAEAYPYVVLDNEAGLENLSRRIVADTDTLLLVSDASGAGIKTLLRLHGLTKEMEISYKKLILIINRVRSESVPPAAAEAAKLTGADETVCIPDDAEVADFMERGQPLTELPDSNAAVKIIDKLIESIFREKG
ncbi:MAG: AAA family ATPase [Defluviitaleaceae bacterium]|nr:AAA family ATPase [Defluviitaleaceae bacterium]